MTYIAYAHDKKLGLVVVRGYCINCDKLCASMMMSEKDFHVIENGILYCEVCVPKPTIQELV